MESSGPIFLTKGNDIPYLYVLTFGWKPYLSTVLSVTHLSFIIINGKRFYFSRSDGFEPSKSKYRNLNYYPFFNFAVCFPLRRGRDSNPRTLLRANGFQDRRNRPLCHLSIFNISNNFCKYTIFLKYNFYFFTILSKFSSIYIQ